VLRLVLLTFEPRLRNMTAREFAEVVLHKSLRAKGLLLGYDSALGKGREGTPQRFAELGPEFGFCVETGARFELDGKPVSSTAIRAAIASGDLAQAQRYLGRPPGALGTVVHGDARGRTLGFPTANVEPQAAALPPPGVYAVEAIVDGRTWPAVANLGARPTFGDGEPSSRLEVHLLGFAGDLYGRELEVTFRSFLRGERKFASAEALREQIARDVEAARQALQA
jgi:riboflavin kinase/FMN adenylyltransferase